MKYHHHNLGGYCCHCYGVIGDNKVADRCFYHWKNVHHCDIDNYNHCLNEKKKTHNETNKKNMVINILFQYNNIIIIFLYKTIIKMILLE